MAKITIDIDYGMLADAARIFDTVTKTSTVNAALADAVRRREHVALAPSLKQEAPADNRAETIDDKPVPGGSQHISTPAAVRVP